MKIIEDARKINMYGTHLPQELVSLLEQTVLLRSRRESMTRIDSLKLLAEIWQELDENEEGGLSRWIARHGSADLRIRRNPNGSLSPVPRRATINEEAIATTIPKALVAELMRNIAEVRQETRYQRIAEIEYLLGEWESLMMDPEKMLGHLIVFHGINELEQVSGESHAGLTRLHSQLHRGKAT